MNVQDRWWLALFAAGLSQRDDYVKAKGEK